MGHILRQGPGHITYTALAAQSARNKEGNLLMDSPPLANLNDLIHLAMVRGPWSAMVRHIPVQSPTRYTQHYVRRRSTRRNLSTTRSVSL